MFDNSVSAVDPPEVVGFTCNTSSCHHSTTAFSSRDTTELRDLAATLTRWHLHAQSTIFNDCLIDDIGRIYNRYQAIHPE
jgi:hypothetical protein